MTYDELIKLLEDLEIPVSIGIQNDKDTNKFPRIVLMEMVWEEISASNKSYSTEVTYQISFMAEKPRDVKLLELRSKLHEKGLRPQIYHEFVEKPKQIHSFLQVQVLEDLV